MGRPRATGTRVLGPYEYKVPGRETTWRIVIIGTDDSRYDQYFSTEAEAESRKEELIGEIARDDELTIEKAIEAYHGDKRLDGNKEDSITTSNYRLKQFFNDTERTLKSLNPDRCEKLYTALVKNENISVDTHRNALQEAKRFLKWCVKVKKWLPANPAADVEGRGKRSCGKAQHYVDEARKFTRYTLACADAGDCGALSALTALFTSARATEIVRLKVRDLDDNGRILQIAQGQVASTTGSKRKKAAGKTAASARKVRVPEVLRVRLLKKAAGRDPSEYLWGHLYDRRWPLKATKRLCEGAGVPIITVHGLRGTLASLAKEAGVAGEAVARTLGHEDETTTNKHYTRPGIDKQIEFEQGLEVLLEGMPMPDVDNAASAETPATNAASTDVPAAGAEAAANAASTDVPAASAEAHAANAASAEAPAAVESPVSNEKPLKVRVVPQRFREPAEPNPQP